MIVVFQVTKKCNMRCPHCFFLSGPDNKKNLSLTKAINGIKDLKKSKLKIEEFLITGGEPTLWINKRKLYPKYPINNSLFTNSNTKKIIELIKENFPSSKIRIDTNGMLFYKHPGLFDIYNPNSFQLSIDLMHKKGASKEDSNLILLSNGKSKLLDFFIKMKKKYQFKIYVRWTSNRKDELIFKKFKKRYSDLKGNIIITKKFVTKTGRGEKMSIQETGKGFLIEENTNNFKCLFGEAIILSIDGLWYGCYHPCRLTKLGKPENNNLKDSLKDLYKNPCLNIIKKKGILEYLKYAKNTLPKSREKILNILKKRYWYRCEPCLEAQKRKVLV